MTLSILTFDRKTGVFAAAAATGSLCVGRQEYVYIDVSADPLTEDTDVVKATTWSYDHRHDRGTPHDVVHLALQADIDAAQANVAIANANVSAAEASLAQAQAKIDSGEPDAMLGPIGFIYCEDAQASAAAVARLAVVANVDAECRGSSAAPLPTITAAISNPKPSSMAH
mgnify:CR=1 FL=1